MRRTSSAKIYHHLSVEAPITKVINILMSARESSPPYIAQALDKVSICRIVIKLVVYYKQKDKTVFFLLCNNSGRPSRLFLEISNWKIWKKFGISSLYF